MENCACAGINYDVLDEPGREFVRGLHAKNICTNSSEGGGRGHATPDFAYVEVFLSKGNLRRAQRAGFVLDRVYDAQGNVLFGKSAREYGEKTGFYLVGLNRSKLLDKEVKQRLERILRLFRPQGHHKKYEPFY